MQKKDENLFLKKAKELGATAAKFIATKEIKVGSWTRWKCQYGCPKYGQTLCCPPFCPSYEDTQRFLKEFSKALLVQMTFKLDKKDLKNLARIDENISNSLLQVLLKIEREAFLHNYYKAFALTAGSCHLCKKCNLKKCKHPLEARPSMEACGIDVMDLVNANGYKADIITGPITEMKVYGIVLID